MATCLLGQLQTCSQVKASILLQAWLGQRNRVTGVGHKSSVLLPEPVFLHLTIIPKLEFLEQRNKERDAIAKA